MLGFLVTALTANAGNPISHATTLQGFNALNAYTGETMDFFTYFIIGTPVMKFLVPVLKHYSFS